MDFHGSEKLLGNMILGAPTLLWVLTPGAPLGSHGEEPPWLWQGERKATILKYFSIIKAYYPGKRLGESLSPPRERAPANSSLL